MATLIWEKLKLNIEGVRYVDMLMILEDESAHGSSPAQPWPIEQALIGRRTLQRIFLNLNRETFEY